MGWWTDIKNQVTDTDSAFHEYNPFSPYNQVFDAAGDKVFGKNFGDLWGGGEIGNVSDGGFIGDNYLGGAEEKAAEELIAALEAAGGDVRQQFGIAGERLDPYMGMAGSLPGLQQRASQGDYTVNPGEFNFQEDPGYQFAKEEGIEGILKNLRSRGLTESGGEQKEIAKYITGLAGQQYNQGYDRFMRGNQFKQNQLQNQFGQESGLAGMGMNVVGQRANMDMGLADILSDLAIAKGQAGAAGTMGRASQQRNLINQGFELGGKALAGYAGG